MKRTLIVLLALCVLIFAAFFFAPSSLVDKWVRKQTGGQFALKNSDGSVWEGKGELAITLPDGAISVVPGVQWRIDPVAALGGKLIAELSGAAKGKVRVEGDERVATDVRMSIPASALAAAALLATLAPDGNVDVSIPSARWGTNSGEGTGELVWNNATIALPNIPQRIALGTVRVQGQLVGPNVNFTVSNEGGALALNGGGSWPRGGIARYDVAFTPRPGFPPDQLAALSAVTKPDANGAYRMRLP
jgi:Type II secretion system (T2SS), protein N